MVFSTATSIGSWDITASPLILLSVAAALVPFFWWSISSNPLDPREPPELKPTIPFIGHLFGLLWHQTEYFKILSRKIKIPVFTIRILGTRIYVIGSPELVQKVFSNPKAFTFDSFVAESSRRFLNMDEEAMRIFNSPAPGFEDGRSYSENIHELVYESLASGSTPGSGLTEMSARMQSELVSQLNNIDPTSGAVGLWRWTRDIVTRGTCSALYGFNNLVADDQRLIDSLWDVEDNFNMLLLNVMPRVIARKAFQGRDRLNSAFRKYFGGSLWKNGAPIVKGRVKIATRHGYSGTQIADYEVVMLFASVTNAIPFSFWMLSYIIADSELNASILKEVESLVTRRVVDGIEIAEMDLTMVRTNCPLLVSIWEELLRWNTNPTSVRSVTSDIMLENEYFLKAGAVVQMPSGVTHSSAAVWGPDASEFNPRRFLKKDKSSQKEREQHKLQNKAYFPFGGGKHFCPGRHFAFTEVMGFVSMIVYAFTIENKDGTPFKVLKQAQRQLGAAINKPKGDVDVVIRRRKGLEGVKLAFKSGTTNS